MGCPYMIQKSSILWRVKVDFFQYIKVQFSIIDVLSFISSRSQIVRKENSDFLIKLLNCLFNFFSILLDC